MNDLRTILLIGGPVAWALLIYLGWFFAVGLYGLVSNVLAILQGA